MKKFFVGLISFVFVFVLSEVVLAKDNCENWIIIYGELIKNFDRNQDLMIDLSEVNSALESWSSGKIKDNELLAILNFWKEKCKLEPSLTVISPNGGEVWEIGKSYEIKWKHFALAGEKIDIFLIKWVSKLASTVYSPQGVVYPPEGIKIASDIPVEQGSYLWNIPTDIPEGKDYAVYIRQSTGTKKAFDISDRPFAIVLSKEREDPVSGTLSVDKKEAKVGEPITLTITAQDLQGVWGVSAFYHNKWDFKSCDFATSCTQTFTFSESWPGTYLYRGYVYGKKLNGEIESKPTNPPVVRVKLIRSPSAAVLPEEMQLKDQLKSLLASIEQALSDLKNIFGE
jgi:hypothetical protein